MELQKQFDTALRAVIDSRSLVELADRLEILFDVRDDCTSCEHAGLGEYAEKETERVLCALPVFGGEQPSQMHVLSWDSDSLLYVEGPCVEIVERGEP